MDSKRLILFIALSFGILLLWQEYFAPPPKKTRRHAKRHPDCNRCIHRNRRHARCGGQRTLGYGARHHHQNRHF